jgi:3-hydroxyisobutyrate dehydrogenase
MAMTEVAFLGTGLLASGMIEAMRHRGVDVTVWNRTVSKARALEPLGVRVAATAEDAVAAASEVHIVLSDDRAVDEVLARIGPRLRSDAIVIDHSTTAPAATKARLERAAAQGLRLLHAPVFMSPQMCRDAVGLMMVSGPAAVFAAARDALTPMTGEVWYVGERPDLAAAYKIFGNAMLFVMTAGLADVFAMAKSLDIPAADAAGVFSRFKIGGVVGQRAAKIATGDFTASFELTMARKDMRLMMEAAGVGMLTVLPAIAAKMDEAIAGGRGQQDLSAIAAESVAVSR